MAKTVYRSCRECFNMTQLPASKCSHCGSDKSFQDNRCEYNTVHRVFSSGWYRDIADEPVYIKGRKDLLAETRSRGQVSLYAED